MARLSRSEREPQPDYAEGIQILVDDGDARFNTALARGLAVLRAFDIDQPLLGNQELARVTGVPKSTVSRLTFTLTRLGYLRHRVDVDKYELAAGVVGLAYPYIANQAAPALARPLMVALANETRTNIGLGVAEGLSVLYLEYALGERQPNRRQRAGFRVPLVRTSMGRACIAGLESRRRAALYDELRDAYPREWPLLREQLDDACEQVARVGYCIVAGSFQRQTTAVAVPFPSSDGRSVMAFNSQAGSHWQTRTRAQAHGERLIALAAAVRRQWAEQALPAPPPGSAGPAARPRGAPA